MGTWLKKNAINFVIVGIVGLIIWALVFRSAPSFSAGLADLWIWIVVGVGIGFLIFIHELGHFLAAKLCNVKVETFSVGFGPPIPGCHFRRGETLYKLAWFPLGGYVKMAGEYPNEQMDEEIRNDPRAFMNKTVGQRMIIISAGVVANVIVGMVCFTVVYQTGKMQLAPAVSYVEPGSPAALAGVEAGSKITQIDDNTNPTFEDLLFTTLLSRPGSTQIHMKWRTPAGEDREGMVIPHRLGKDARPVIGAGFPSSLKVIDPGRQNISLGFPRTPASAAPFKPGDRIVAIRRADDPKSIPLTDGWQYTALEGRFRGQPIVVTVQRNSETVDVPVEPRYFWSFGFRFEPGPIEAVVKEPTYRPESARALEVGDVIVGLNGDRSFDALRLPDLIRELAQKDGPIKLTVARAGTEMEIDIKAAEIKDRGTWEEQSPNNQLSPVGVPALGIAYRVQPVLRGVDPDSPAATAKLEPGDILKSVTYEESAGKKKTIELGEVQWPALFFLLQHSAESETVEFKVMDKSGNERRVSLASVEDRTWPFPNRGLRRERESSILKADGVGQAIWLGFRDTYRNIARMYMSLHSMARGYVSAKDNLSGPFRILDMLHDTAEHEWTEFLFLLGFISVNLAVVNFLPIPILDGGHMVFLIVEKLRGKPVHERVLLIATIAGLVLIIALMLTVILLDLSWFGWLPSWS